VSVFQGEVSQSYQVAPFNYKYEFVNTTPATTIHTPDKTKINTYKGGVFQQAVSAITYIDDNNYDNQGYATYGYEYWSNPKKRDEGYITWYSEGQPSWTITAAAVAGDPTVQIGNRLISEEPMVRFLISKKCSSDLFASILSSIWVCRHRSKSKIICT
jgi:hypothetical protein